MESETQIYAKEFLDAKEEEWKEEPKPIGDLFSHYWKTHIPQTINCRCTMIPTKKSKGLDSLDKLDRLDKLDDLNKLDNLDRLDKLDAL